MRIRYAAMAGQSVERLAALSDGVFAIALTLLVLDLHVPDARALHSEADLWAALLLLAPRLVPYLLSFMTLGIFWVGQQTQLNQFARSDRTLPANSCAAHSCDSCGESESFGGSRPS